MEVLRWTADHFGTKGISTPRLDAELIIAHALNLRRIDLYMRPELPLDEAEREAIRALIRRRLDGEPVAYITGQKEFWAMSFRVTRDVLVPRPETEEVVEQAHLILLPKKGDPIRFLDLGTGSGCIAAALAKEFPHSLGVATDISPAALEVASQNLSALGFNDRVRLREGNLYKALEPDDGPFDLIISNPPYIPTEDMATLPAEVKSEPAGALDGGVEGLDFIRPIIADGAEHLNPEGFLVLETHGKHGDVISCLPGPGLVFKGTRTDLAGILRVAWWQKA